MKKLTVLVDMDGIVTDMLDKWIEYLNKKHNRNVKPEDVKDWDMGKTEGYKDLKANNVYKVMHKPMFFYNLDPLPGSIDAMEVLVKDGHDVRFLTTPANAHSAYEKLLWVDRWFPFVGTRNVILANDKHLVRGDVFIDDKPDHLRKYQATWPESLVLTIKYGYNDLPMDTRIKFVGDHTDTVRAWQQIVLEVRQKSGTP